MRAILLVEDDDRFRKILAKFLRREGYFVQDVGSGTAALSLIERSPFDLLITDYQLGDKIDGFDVLARFERVWPGKGKIVMSGHDLKSRCDSSGALFISKPPLLDDLRTQIRTVLSKKEPPFANVAIILSEQIARARGQKAECGVLRERANEQRTFCIEARSLNRQVHATFDDLRIRMEKLQRARSLL